MSCPQSLLVTLARLAFRPSEEKSLKASGFSDYTPVHNAVVTLRLICLTDHEQQAIAIQRLRIFFATPSLAFLPELDSIPPNISLSRKTTSRSASVPVRDTFKPGWLTGPPYLPVQQRHLQASVVATLQSTNGVITWYSPFVALGPGWLSLSA